MGNAKTKVRLPNEITKDKPLTLEEVFTMDNLLEAYKNVRSGKTNREFTIKYEQSFLIRLYDLQQRIFDDKYKMGKLIRFKVYEPKEREVVADKFEDKIVQDVLSKKVLMPLISPRLIFDNYASQPGKGNLLAVQRLERHMAIHAKSVGWTDKGWVLSCDIKKYFYSIDHKVYLDMIDKLYMDSRLNKLMHMQTDICTKDINPYIKEDGRGLCIGFETSQWGAVYYLSGLDHYIKEELHIKCYGRYMDDFYLIHESREYLEECLDKIQKYVEEKLNLTLNSKTYIHPFSQGVCFLGYHCMYNPDTHQIVARIRAKSVKKMRRRAKENYKRVVHHTLDVDTAVVSLDSWWAYAKHGKTKKAENAYKQERKKLKKLEHKNAEWEFRELCLDDNNLDEDGFFILHKNISYFSHDKEGFYTLIPHKVTKKELKQDAESHNVASHPVYADIMYDYMTGRYKPPKIKRKGGRMSKSLNSKTYAVTADRLSRYLDTIPSRHCAKLMREGLKDFKL